VIDGEVVRNQLVVHLINKNATPTVLTLKSLSDAPLELIIPQPSVSLESLGSMEVPVIASIPRAAFKPGIRVRLEVTDSASKTSRQIDAALTGPNHNPNHN
jgi:hypothetical protein